MRKLLLALLFMSCNSRPSPEVLKAQHEYDSIKEFNKHYQKCLDCEIQLLSKGVDSTSSKKECEAIWMK